MCCDIGPFKLKQSSGSQFAMSSNHGRMKLFIIKKYFKLIVLDDAMWPWCMHACVGNVYMSMIKIKGSIQMCSTWIEIK